MTDTNYFKLEAQSREPEAKEPEPASETGQAEDTTASLHVERCGGGFNGRSDAEMAAWERSGDHSLAAELLFRMGIEPTRLLEEKPTQFPLGLQPPYTPQRIMDTIAEVTRSLAEGNVDLKQGNAILYALQTLLTASRVLLQEQQAEARSKPRQHLHIHQHQQIPPTEAKEATPWESQIASAATQPPNTLKLTTGHTPGEETASTKKTAATGIANAPAIAQPKRDTRKRSGTGNPTPGQKKQPSRGA